MLRHTISLFLIVLASITVSKPVSSEVFTGSGLVDIPTGRVLQHGIFEAGTYLGFQQRMMDHSTTNLGDAVAVRLNFGLFDRVEVGLTHLWNEYGERPSADRTANLKFQLLKEPETGAIPSIAIGIEKLGRDIVLWDSEAEADESASAFLAISKTFNLPRIHQFSGHIGIGTQRFAFSERPIGLFVGLRKEFRPAFARGNITTSLEFDGAGVNLGVRYAASSGLQVALGAETLNNPDELRYLASVSWTNAQILEQIDETRRLIKLATELAVQAKRASAEKE
ncbi:YjbH domain-containing protein [Candidatus Poribacteria bacterium]|nr:YjbH domain-containing protein [Candidatus Poribacteria bacterium]MYH81870.1 YjbH domain-containing protein [Candidatus Poribacteria bacterium]MYK92675.1 YjbH domain-containing protein [Candidatus Poribacteria bacterium]